MLIGILIGIVIGIVATLVYQNNKKEIDTKIDNKI